MTRRALAVLTGCALLGAVAQIAGAGDVTTRDRAGDVKAKGLTAAERAAIDIVSLRTSGEEGLGVLVTTTFRGNFEQAFGRGHLKNAAAVMILWPKPGKGAPAGLVTLGAGKATRNLRKTRSEAVGVVRGGRTLRFYVVGGGLSNVARVEVRVVANVPPASLRTTASLAGQTPLPAVAESSWAALIKKVAADGTGAAPDVSRLSCDELRALRIRIKDTIAVADEFPSARANLERFEAAVDALIAERCGQPKLDAEFTWHFFSSNEVAGSGEFTGPAGSITAIRVVVPPSGSTARAITNRLCPAQLPTASVTGNTIVCSGGTLAVGQQFTLNLQTSPLPTPDMGGQLFGELGSEFVGPFPITGP
jgi:hypothetical protein